MLKRNILTFVAPVLAVGLMASCSKLKSPHSADQGPQNTGHLGSIRTALSIFYGDSQGRYPKDLMALVPKHLPSIPQVSGIKEHQPSNHVVLAHEPVATDSGGWLYVNDPRSKAFGEVMIDCTHQRQDGKPWSSL